MGAPRAYSSQPRPLPLPLLPELPLPLQLLMVCLLSSRPPSWGMGCQCQGQQGPPGFALAQWETILPTKTLKSIHF